MVVACRYSMSPVYLFLLFSAFLFADFENLADYQEEPSRIEEEAEDLSNLDLMDLEAMRQDFVLETKRIHIDGYPDAYNPSIVRWKGRFLLSFRTYDPKTRSANEVALVYLDENFDPIEAPHFVKFQSKDPYCLSKRQDPRLIIVKGRLYLVYNNALRGEVRRMLIAELIDDEDGFRVENAECLLHFEGERETRSEKNWVPFEYNQDLYLAYSLVPHKILHPIYGSSSCEMISCPLASIKWDWGVLRGGTPALLEGSEYLAFFHSSKNMATQNSKGKNIQHYFMGAYTFSANPPFEITRMSPSPIVGKFFYSGRAYKTWKPLRVVFPGGYVADEKYIWILYGRQDHESWVAKLDKQALMDSLVLVKEL